MNFILMIDMHFRHFLTTITLLQSFTVKFNNNDILKEIDLYKIIGNAKYAADFVLKFQVVLSEVE